MADFRMPSLGADMEAGTLVQWVKQPGDAVRRGDIIAVVDTQKGAIEIEVFEDGMLEELVVKPGEKVPVGTVLARIRGAGVSSESFVAPPPAAIPSPIVAPGPPLTPLPIAAAEPPHRPRVSPMARKLAEELRIDLDAVIGTGPEGSITRDDVQRAAAETARPAQPRRSPRPPRPSPPQRQSQPPRPSPPRPAPPLQPVQPSDAVPPPQPRQPPRPSPSLTAAPDRSLAMRAAIAAAMAKSKREIPHYYLSTTIDLGAAMAWLRTENERRPVTERLLPAVLLLKAVALALREVPELNGYWTDGAFRKGAGIHVGCAISLRGGGLVAPALHDADTLDVDTLMRRLQDLVARARTGTLKSSEVTDATITVTNLGDQGAESTFGIIYPPQVALVGFGRISERPWVVDGKVEARHVVAVTLSGDHRATDGHRGGVFLASVNRLLQTPDML